MQPLEALNFLLPCLTWFAEFQNRSKALSAALRPATPPGAASAAWVAPGGIDLDASLDHYCSQVLAHMSVARRPSYELANEEMCDLLQRVGMLLRTAPENIAGWLLGFVVPWSLAETESASKRPLDIKLDNPPMATYTVTRRLHDMGMEMCVKITNRGPAWALWGKPGIDTEGLNAGDVLVVSFNNDIQGHLMILDVKFAKPKRSEGKPITERRNIIGFDCGVVSAFLTAAKGPTRRKMASGAQDT